METTNLNKHIRDLLYRYDCVVIPGFGGFVASYQSASINKNQHLFSPPSKAVTFNRMLVMNDGLLAQHISSEEGITYNEALELISGLVYLWTTNLNKGLPIEISGLGRIFTDDLGLWQFQVENDQFFLPESYGLTSFQVFPVKKESQLKIARPTITESDQSLPRIPVFERATKVAVAAAVISMAALTAYKFQLVQNIKLDQVSLNPFKSENSVYHSREYSIPEAFVMDESSIKKIMEETDEAYLTYPTVSDKANKGFVVKTGKEMPAAEVQMELKYHVVGGCFGVKSNADKMLKKLKRKGFDANTPGIHKGLHVVSYQSFATRNEADLFLQKVKAEQNPQAWILFK